MSKIVLFDGTDLSHFTNLDGSPAQWKVENGTMTVTHGNIKSKETYGDAHIHVEWMEPDMPDATGQWKGNSGVYIQGCYELQVLDSYGIEPPRDNDCGGIYSIQAPRVNACKPALEWQTYDIYLRAAKVEGDKVVEAAIVTILQNGQVIHNNLILPHHTPGGVYDRVVAEGPLMLQDHGNPVTFRNIWVEKL
ncbi:MAG: DUF1080 domain-containing protein [Clostridia bacterium]|nr:DUF1080 domain-containing protein [Clostridia bacterium]